MKSVLVKGWLDIYHSYALVNYFQLKYLQKQDVSIYFEEVPYYCPKWKKIWNNDLNIQKYNGEKIDCILRIAFPYVIEKTDKKQILFYTAEHGVFMSEYFNKTLEEIRSLVASKKLILLTPSENSARAFKEHNIHVEIIPHGVDREIYYPKKVDRISNSKTFLHVSAFSRNKNLGQILKAFRDLDDDSILILKGSKDLYEVNKTLNELMCKEFGKMKREDFERFRKRLRLITNSCSFKEMNTIYNMCDAYIDAGINEGFCMPIIEAIACGKPVITNERAPLAHLASGTFKDTQELVGLMKEISAPYSKVLPEEYDWANIADKLKELV